MYPPSVQEQMAANRARSERALDRMRQQDQHRAADHGQDVAEFAQRQSRQSQEFVAEMFQRREELAHRMASGLAEAGILTAGFAYLQDRFRQRGNPQPTADTGQTEASTQNGIFLQAGPVVRTPDSLRREVTALTSRLLKSIAACIVIVALASWWFIATYGAAGFWFPLAATAVLALFPTAIYLELRRAIQALRTHPKNSQKTQSAA